MTHVGGEAKANEEEAMRSKGAFLPVLFLPAHLLERESFSIVISTDL